MSTAYDAVAYPASIFIQTHPDRLAAVAHLHGLSAPDVATARVLEIGGGDGINSIALATAYPDAQFLSFDLSVQAVMRGKAAIKAAGLTNVMVERGDILDAARDLTQPFDYILCHGVYAWVPAIVRQGIMQLIGNVLAPDGVAFVSYNAMPGGHLRLALRQMLLREVAGIEDPEARLAAAHAFLDDYILPTENDRPPQAALRGEAKMMRNKSPSVLFHDELGEVFEPQALFDVVEAAAAHGLEFLGDTADGLRGDGFLPDDAEDLSPRAVARAAQIYDDERVRFFRQSLFVRAGRAPGRRFDPQLMQSVYISSNCKRLDEITFSNRRGEYKIDLPDEAAILQTLIDHHPGRVRAGELSSDPKRLGSLLTFFEGGLAELNVSSPPFATAPTTRPEISALARAQLLDGQTEICALDHRIISVTEEAPRAFLLLLDGSRTLQDLEVAWREHEFADKAPFDGAMGLAVRAAMLKPEPPQE